MPVPASIADLSTSPGANSPAGTETPTEGDNYIRTLSAFIAQLRDQLNGTSGSPVVLTLTVTNGLTVNGAAALNGNTTLGNAGADSLTINGSTITLNNAPTIGGAASWSAAQTFSSLAISSGPVAPSTYTPTLTGVANVSSSIANVCQYVRVGNVITVSGRFLITPTLPNNATSLAISLPVASNFSGLNQGCGTAVRAVAGALAGSITSDATNDYVVLRFFNDSESTSMAWAFTFTYQVI